MRRFLQVLLGVLVVVAISATVQATVIAQHVGLTDPTTEGWTQNLGTAGNTVNDGGTPAWEINAERTRYIADVTSQVSTLQSSTWEVDATLRDVVIPYDPKSMGIYLELSYGTGSAAKTYALAIGSAATNSEVKCDVTDFVGNYVPLMNVGVYGSGYHTFQIVRDNAASDDAKVYVDGNFESIINASTGVTTISGLNRFVWGASGDLGAANADARWSSVSLTTNVPEPSTVALLITGALGLIAYAWRKCR